MKPRNSKNIAFIGPLPPPFGGVAVMNKSFQEILCQEWNILPFNTSGGAMSEDLYKRKSLKNISHFAKNIFHLFKFIAKNNFKIANVFATSNTAFVRDSIIIFILWCCGKKIIVHFHSKKRGEFFLGRFSIKYIALVFKFVQKIIVLSDNHYKHFANYFSPSKMVVIENFVDYELYKCEIEDKNLDFLYVSRLSKQKGIFDLLNAVKIIKEKGYSIKINVLGNPDNDETNKIINQKIEEYNLKDNIILRGNVFGVRKYNFFKKSGIFIFPSHFENSPLVLKEAIASKMAIIASNIEANKLILIDKGNTSFFVTGDAFDLANKMEYLLLNSTVAFTYMKTSEACKIYDKANANKLISSILENA